MFNTSIPTTQDGQTLYSYRQVSVGVDKGAVHEHGVAKKAKLSGAQADALADMFHSIAFTTCFVVSVCKPWCLKPTFRIIRVFLYGQGAWGLDASGVLLQPKCLGLRV